MSKWLSWSCLAALGLVTAACNGATVPVGLDTGADSGSHGSTSCSGTPLQCPAHCEGTVAAGPGECVDGTWTCVVPSCPAEPDSGPTKTYDASAGCTASPPTCGPCPQGYEPPTPACLDGVWTCGDICGGADYDGGDDGSTIPDDGGYLPDDGGYLPEDAGPICTGNTPTCPAACDGTVPPSPAACEEGVWTCLPSGCIEPDDASEESCDGQAPTCAPGCEGTVYYPSCVSGQWSCVQPTCG